MLHTTFALAKQAGACKDSYRRYAKHVGEVRRYGQDTPIPLTDILDVLGVEDALWCLRCVLPEQSSERDRLATLLAADFAEHVAPLWMMRAAREAAWEAAGTAAWTAREAAAWEAERSWQAQRLRERLTEEAE